jgi:Fe-S cluster biogenesis protein NfuA
METKLIIQSTPNPNALKFVLNTPVKNEGNYTYKSADHCEYNPLAAAIFALNSHIKEVYFFDNYITVTQDGNADWDILEGQIQQTILEKIKDHDPNFKTEEPKKEASAATPKTPEMSTIDSILDQTVRPALQMDGGDIQLVSYDNNLLKVFYQGACGSCPSSSMGTMKAIENILKDQFNPEITVELAEVY